MFPRAKFWRVRLMESAAKASRLSRNGHWTNIKHPQEIMLDLGPWRC